MIEIEYKISLHLSKFLAYQSKNKNKGIVKLFISVIWKYVRKDFDRFVIWINYLTILERICLERAFQKIRMKNRCKPYKDFLCKIEQIAYLML